jgi:hypothetical protein
MATAEWSNNLSSRGPTAALTGLIGSYFQKPTTSSPRNFADDLGRPARASTLVYSGSTRKTVAFETDGTVHWGRRFLAGAAALGATCQIPTNA